MPPFNKFETAFGNCFTARYWPLANCTCTWTEDTCLWKLGEIIHQSHTKITHTHCTVVYSLHARTSENAKARPTVFVPGSISDDSDQDGWRCWTMLLYSKSAWRRTPHSRYVQRYLHEYHNLVGWKSIPQMGWQCRRGWNAVMTKLNARTPIILPLSLFANSDILAVAQNSGQRKSGTTLVCLPWVWVLVVPWLFCTYCHERK